MTSENIFEIFSSHREDEAKNLSDVVPSKAMNHLNAQWRKRIRNKIRRREISEVKIRISEKRNDEVLLSVHAILE